MAISLLAQKTALKEGPLLGFKYTFSLRQTFTIISVLRPLIMVRHRFLRTACSVLNSLTHCEDFVAILKGEVDRRAFRYFLTAKMYTRGTLVASSKLYTCSTFPLEIIFDAKSTEYVHTTFCQLNRLETTKAALKKNGLNCLHVIYTKVKHILQRSLHKNHKQRVLVCGMSAGCS